MAEHVDEWMMGGLSVGQLKALIEVATRQAGGFGHDLPEGKPVVVGVGERSYRMDRVSVAVVGGTFSLVLQAGPEIR